MTKTEENIRGGIFLALFAAIGAGIIWLVAYSINWILVIITATAANFMERTPGVVLFALAWVGVFALELVLLSKNKPSIPPS